MVRYGTSLSVKIDLDMSILIDGSGKIYVANFVNTVYLEHPKRMVEGTLAEINQKTYQLLRRFIPCMDSKSVLVVKNENAETSLK